MFLTLLTMKTANVSTTKRKKSWEDALEARQDRRAQRINQEEMNIENEGDTYVPGGF